MALILPLGFAAVTGGIFAKAGQSFAYWHEDERAAREYGESTPVAMFAEEHHAAPVPRLDHRAPGRKREDPARAICVVARHLAESESEDAAPCDSN